MFIAYSSQFLNYIFSISGRNFHQVSGIFLKFLCLSDLAFFQWQWHSQPLHKHSPMLRWFKQVCMKITYESETSINSMLECIVVVVLYSWLFLFPDIHLLHRMWTWKTYQRPTEAIVILLYYKCEYLIYNGYKTQ